MARRPASVVKDLRVLTERWDESVIPSEINAWTLIRAKELIEELPSFRAAPQTKLENTLRAIESLFQALGVDLRTTVPNPWLTELPTHDERNQKLVRAVMQMINIHYGVGLPPPYGGPTIKVDSSGEAVYEGAPEPDYPEDVEEVVQHDPVPVPVPSKKKVGTVKLSELLIPEYQNELKSPLKPGEKEPF